jgi:hypothetical protein
MPTRRIAALKDRRRWWTRAPSHQKGEPGADRNGRRLCHALCLLHASARPIIAAACQLVNLEFAITATLFPDQVER